MIILKQNNDRFSYKINKYELDIDDSLIKYLSSDIIIEKGVTFEQFFNIILNYHEEYSDFFHSYLNGIQLSEFIDEWNCNQSSDYVDMKRLIIKWPDKYIFDPSNTIDDNSIPEFIGEGKKIENHNIETYSLEFAPIYKLKKYELVLIENYNIYNQDINTPMVTLHRDITVFDVLTSIFTELTYIGNPSERNLELKRIRDRLCNANNINSTSLKEFLSKYDIDLSKK